MSVLPVMDMNEGTYVFAVCWAGIYVAREQ